MSCLGTGLGAGGSGPRLGRSWSSADSVSRVVWRFDAGGPIFHRWLDQPAVMQSHFNPLSAAKDVTIMKYTEILFNKAIAPFEGV